MKNLIVIGLVSIMLTSCATLFGGRVTEHQKTKPKAGEQQRKVRVGALIADILLFWPSLAVDFATGAIYKPLKAEELTPKKVETNKKMY
ncbi:hypothetical protein [Flavobacterium haoranii]|uniref:Uncharacterized protein n=1 Tax=Flavobacterium haoranii TaxID=683124 RepID=A0A1M6H7L6_9FLAO|nr:hypothetical protein [Flavobacterium haoranii]SHJ18185.1 hypothetical protein SAMN05444337_1456 [Flavobacterium haoranii]